MASWRDSYLIDFLKEENARISYEDKWLVWYAGAWRVLQKPPYKKSNRCLYLGDNLGEALEALKS